MALLASHRRAFQHLQVPVLVLSLCPDVATAAAWDAQVGHPFRHIVWAEDTQPAAAYAQLGFTRSLAGVWSEASLGWYAEQTAAGAELHSSRGQDVNQLAGDLVVDAAGRVVLPYYGVDNTDRPSLGTLLRAAAVASAAGDEGVLRGKLQYVQGYLDGAGLGSAAAASATSSAGAAHDAALLTSAPTAVAGTAPASSAQPQAAEEECVE